jgi:integrase
VNRDLAALRAMLSRAVEWGHLQAHPLRSVRALREDKAGRLRYLLPAEETRLRAALKTRDHDRRAERERANEWRRDRGYDPWPVFGEFTDTLTPIVLMALNTGMRFGELTALRWADIDFPLALATVLGSSAKSGKTRHIPLNADVMDTLRAWEPGVPDGSRWVFPGRDGEGRLVDIKTGWMALLRKAEITQFRFHDLRHTFASKLVMASVDLNTVRELLGHADIKMTLRYAHLAPEHKAAAVAKLVATR